MVTVSDAFYSKPGAARTLAFCSLPLAEIKAAGEAQGATANDVPLTVLDVAMVRDSTPAERLASIRAQTGRLKDLMQRESPEAVMLHTTLVHAIPAIAKLLGVKRELKVSNLIVSNPFGLPEQRYLVGAEGSLALPMSMIAAGQVRRRPGGIR